ncbi:MAG: S8 family serine peptidase [Sedimentisphaerales bacterium]|nr:S8 family serine peptidase [Sedimentisphaerales bacterium]
MGRKLGLIGVLWSFFALAAVMDSASWAAEAVETGVRLEQGGLEPDGSEQGGLEPNCLEPVCLEVLGVRGLASAEGELAGSSVRVGLIELCKPAAAGADYAFVPNFGHESLRNAKLVGMYHYNREFQVSAHASMIAGVLVGDDPNAALGDEGRGIYRGVVPGAELSVYETNWFIYNKVLSPSAGAVEADVLSISWGTDANDAITNWWQRGIDVLPERDGCVVVAGCGNGEGEFSAVSKPSQGYNVISVGTARSLGEYPDCLRYVGPPLPDYSSCGPTEDGRAKPDVLAGGLLLGPSVADGESYCRAKTDVGYSSFAGPQVAGIAALLMDAARKQSVESGDNPLLIKALILNGANKLESWHKGTIDPEDDHEVPLDYRQGAGLADAENSYEVLMAGRYREAEPINLYSIFDPNAVFDAGQSNRGWDVGELVAEPNVGEVEPAEVYYLNSRIKAGEFFKATLCWYLGYQQRGVYEAKELVNLQLELWEMDEQGRLKERVDYSASEVDNLQHIFYEVKRDFRGALVVKGQTEQLAAADGVEFALVFSDGDGNWGGDQLTSDLNGDGIVDIDDLLQFIRMLRKFKDFPDLAEVARDRSYLREDLNGDGTVDGQDFEVFSRQWQMKSAWYRGG